MSQAALQTFSPSPSSPRRERPKSRLSFMSDRSSENKPRIDLTETTRDKRRLNIFSKSNPNSAITEAEPGARAGIEGNTLGYLRQFEHKDNDGNLISDPDRSNPTRPRLERPLDTIRSFEAAISRSYRQNVGSSRTDTQSTYDGMPATRRSSAHNILDQFQQPRPTYSSHRSYQPDLRSRNYRQDQRRDYYQDQHSSYGAPSRKPAPYRNNSEPILYGNHQQSPYNYNQNQGYYESYDTDHTASGSSPSEPWANSTDPSSEDSSLDPHAAHMYYGKPDAAAGAYTTDPYGRPTPSQPATMDGIYPQPMARAGAQPSYQRPSQLNPNAASSNANGYSNNSYGANGYTSSGNTTPGASYTYSNGATANPPNPAPPAVPPKQASGYAQNPYAQLGNVKSDMQLNTQAQPVGKRTGKLAKQMSAGAQGSMTASRTRSHDMYNGNGPSYRPSPASAGMYDSSLARHTSKDDGEKKKGWLRRTFSSKKR